MQGMVPLSGFGGVPYSAVRKAAPRNILDNSDFTNPVNQRGQDKYTSGYGFDRWRIYADSTSMEKSDGSIVIAGAGIWQNLDKVSDGVYTLAAKAKNGTISIATGTFAGGAASSDLLVQFSSSAVGMPSALICAGDWVWAALYEGSYTAETLPEYQPKGYGAELAACQRYYQRFSSGTQTYFVFALGYMQSATSCRFFLPLTVPMRAKPTINSPNGVYFNYGPSSTRVAVSSFSVNNMLPNQVFLSAVTASDVTVGTVGEVMTTTSTGNYIELLADL